jgi:hypothetical protein
MVVLSAMPQAVEIAMIIIAIHASFQEGEALFFIPAKTYSWPWWITKPLYGCLKCMTLWYGLAGVTLFGGNYLAVPVAVGINVIMSKILEDGDSVAA